MMRLLSVIIVSASTLLGAVAAAEPKDEASEIRHAEVGKVLILDFPGNRAMAHRWRLVTERSTGLQLVAVDPLGWIVADGGSIMYGNRDTMRYRVVPMPPAWPTCCSSTTIEAGTRNITSSGRQSA